MGERIVAQNPHFLLLFLAVGCPVSPEHRKERSGISGHTYFSHTDHGSDPQSSIGPTSRTQQNRTSLSLLPIQEMQTRISPSDPVSLSGTLPGKELFVTLFSSSLALFPLLPNSLMPLCFLGFDSNHAHSLP